MRSIYKFFDKLEDKIRGKLSHYPILYAFLGGVGVVLFWRGIWHTTDFISDVVFSYQQNDTIDLASLPWWDGPLSIVLGCSLLLSTGLFVFDFIGTEAIVSGLRGEKKLVEKMVEKENEEVKIEAGAIEEVKKEVKEIADRLADIEKDLKINK